MASKKFMVHAKKFQETSEKPDGEIVISKTRDYQIPQKEQQSQIENSIIPRGMPQEEVEKAQAKWMADCIKDIMKRRGMDTSKDWPKSPIK